MSCSSPPICYSLTWIQVEIQGTNEFHRQQIFQNKTRRYSWISDSLKWAHSVVIVPGNNQSQCSMTLKGLLRTCCFFLSSRFATCLFLLFVAFNCLLLGPVLAFKVASHDCLWSWYRIIATQASSTWHRSWGLEHEIQLWLQSTATYKSELRSNTHRVMLPFLDVNSEYILCKFL